MPPPPQSKVVDMILARRALLLCRLGTAHPALPASLYDSSQELRVLEDYQEKLPAHAQSIVAKPATELPPPEETDLQLPQSCGVKSARQNRKPTRSSARSSSLSLFQANLRVAREPDSRQPPDGIQMVPAWQYLLSSP